MNTSLLQENLLKALTRTGRILTSKAHLPILQSALLSAKQGELTVTTTNLETTESVVVGAKTDKDGAICVPAKLLTELVMTLPAETVHLSLKDGALCVLCGGTTATIPGMSAGEFPPILEAGKEKGADLDKEDVVLALSLILFSAATDEGRPLLTGIKMRSEEDGLLLAATDGYRLSVKKVKLSLKQDIDMVVPARALGEVVKVAQEEKDEKKLILWQNKEGQLVFSVGQTRITTRVIDGEYPNFEKIIPKTHATRAHVDKDALFRAVKSAAIFARDNANIVRFTINNQKIVVSAATAQVGENTVEVDAQIDGEGGEIAFNSRFLLEFLSNIKESELLFEMTGSLNPGVFRPVKDESLFHVIMPIRVTPGDGAAEKKE